MCRWKESWISRHFAPFLDKIRKERGNMSKMTMMLNNFCVSFENEESSKANKENLGLHNTIRGTVVKIWIVNDLEAIIDYKYNAQFYKNWQTFVIIFGLIDVKKHARSKRKRRKFYSVAKIWIKKWKIEHAMKELT